jgi:transcriptional regulator with GAF, ATPase, and Fis domain
VAINCAAIPENLLETELFGHEKGAFTGAVGRKSGKFEMAHRGTLFLDEIGDLPIGLQAKILRALETRRFERLGSTTSIQVDVRLVAATNRDLKAAVATRRFREDLFFRLSVFPITIPPLRERGDDVTLLAEYYIDKYSRDLNKGRIRLTTAASELLRKYPWPGNVRELQNCIERAVILSDGETVAPRHLHLSFDGPVDKPSKIDEIDPWASIDLRGSLSDVSRRVLAEVERRKIRQALEDASGDPGRAADSLQVSQRWLLGKTRELVANR